jgi:NAD(P)-dependent dehydrogenase (short-subunit alcohol dehydrogenase family)
MKAAEPKVIVITGVTRGLGKALVDRMVLQGHHVFGCGRSQEGVDKLNARLGSAGGHFSVVDVSDYSSVYRWWKEINTIAPTAPDLLINNAAIVNRPAPLWNVDQLEFEKLIDINIKGVANVIRAFIPWMIQRGQGVIVNMSSGWGRSTSPEVASYCASKYAIEGLTLSLAQELPDGLAAIPLNPGIIDTDMLRTCFGRSAASYPGPGEWADRAIPFLLSLGRDQNGQSLTVTTDLQRVNSPG